MPNAEYATLQRKVLTSSIPKPIDEDSPNRCLLGLREWNWFCYFGGMDVYRYGIRICYKFPSFPHSYFFSLKFYTELVQVWDTEYPLLIVYYPLMVLVGG